MTKMTISMNTSGLRWFDTSPPAGRGAAIGTPRAWPLPVRGSLMGASAREY